MMACGADIDPRFPSLPPCGGGLGWGVVLALLLTPAASSHARADDEITYRDATAKKEIRLAGTILSESPSQIVVRQNEGAISQTIPVQDIVDVVYQVPALLRQDYRAALHRETAARTASRADDRRRELTRALEKYQELLPRLTAPNVKCHIEFTIARLYALAAQTDPTLAPTAIEHLTKFLADHPEGWQQIACADLLAGSECAKGDWPGAQKTYVDLLAKAKLAPHLRQDCELKIVDILLRAGKLTEAQQKLAGLSKELTADSPLGLRLEIAQAQCRRAAGQPDAAIGLLERVIARTELPELKARAYNALGDCHLGAKKPRLALWDYLWVDVIYFNHAPEHARALYHLARLFHDFGEPARAQEYRNRLEQDPRFAGTEYRTRFASEPRFFPSSR